MGACVCVLTGLCIRRKESERDLLQGLLLVERQSVRSGKPLLVRSALMRSLLKRGLRRIRISSTDCVNLRVFVCITVTCCRLRARWSGSILMHFVSSVSTNLESHRRVVKKIQEKNNSREYIKPRRKFDGT